ncbi:eukaryotic translation initiation factor 2A isoform X2 [Hydra vulgaris]|uniref:Eukaryotic translation initiation factor 2A n=1 Tax=Hydra vulgaris TaxID=6087 RepID=A0ABM4B6S8_HYDVU
MAHADVLPILATRSSQGVTLIQGKNGFTENVVCMEDLTSHARNLVFSCDGKYQAYCDGVNLKVISMDNGEIVFSVPKQKTTEIVFSPNNTYIACWEPFYTSPKNPDGSPNYDIYNIKTGALMRSVIYKNQSGWAPSWTSDEKLNGRCVNNEVQFFSGDDFYTSATKLYLPNVFGFTFSPSPSLPYMVAAHAVGKKGSPSFVRLFEYPKLGDNQAVANKSFFKADKVEMIWNKKGSALLIMVSAEVDTTGSSYYGETSLHFMSTKGESSLVPFDKRGPVYSVDWNPNSTMFCVVFGFMPAKATLFNTKCEPIFDFGTGPRNICKFNFHGNILCLAGFGNLNGAMEMWNVDGRKIISKPQARDTTYFEWCPDGQHFITSTLSPRLRVSNGYKIWHFSGKMIHSVDSKELYQTTWQPYPDGSFPAPKLSGVVVQAEVKKEVYRPPSARDTPVKKLLLHDEEPPENQRNSENLSAAAIKNKKKRENKSKSKQEGVSNGSNKLSEDPTNNLSVSTGDPEIDKKIKGIKKKLKQIEDLKKNQKDGKVLEKNQLDKLSSEKNLLDELRSLQLK